jgi:hypothetical protein
MLASDRAMEFPDEEIARVMPPARRFSRDVAKISICRNVLITGALVLWSVRDGDFAFA